MVSDIIKIVAGLEYVIEKDSGLVITAIATNVDEFEPLLFCNRFIL